MEEVKGHKKYVEKYGEGIYHLRNFVKKKTKEEKKEFNSLPGFDTHIYFKF